MRDQFPAFWGEVPNEKLLKAGPTLFLACDESIFHEVKWSSMWLSKMELFSTPEEKSMKWVLCVTAPLTAPLGRKMT
jgi:hypothetical protein